MKGAFAGLHDRAGREPRPQERLEAALAGEGEVRCVRFGPLALGWTGPSEPAEAGGGIRCLLHGTLYEPATPAAVAAAYAQRRDASLPELRGAFALALWDDARGEGLVVRDQLGEMPIYWHTAGDVVVFSSELHCLLRLLPRRPSPDAVTVAHWLDVSGQPQDRTLYEGVRRVEAGHLLALGPDGAAPRRYWRPSYREPLAGPRAEHVARLRQEIVRSLERRGADAERTAFLLSGGLDSSSVAGLARRSLGLSGAPRRAYSATFPEHPAVDESELIGQLCGTLGLESTRAEVRGGSVLAGALAYLDRWGVPPISPNLFFWLPLLRRAAADGVEVMLDGEGGDEAFSLSPYLLADRLRSGRLVSFARLAQEVPTPRGRRTSASYRWLLRRFAVKGLAPAGLHTLSRRFRPPERYVPDWFLPATVRAWHEGDDPGGWKRLDGPRWWAWLVEATSRGMGPALGYEHVRRRNVLAGIEPRHPLVDVDVLELVYRLPPELSFDRRFSRPLLREAVEGIVPDEIRLRAGKSSFDAVFHDSLAGDDLAVARLLLGSPDSRIGAYVDAERFRQTLLEPDPPPPGLRRQTWALSVWRALTAECWLREQEDEGFCRRTLEAGNLARPRLLIV